MRESVILDFAVPIWKLFFNSRWEGHIPYEFMYNNKKYRNGVTIVHFGWYAPHFIETIRSCLHKFINPILCVPDEESKRALESANLNCFAIVLAGHNAFINEDYYTIKPEIPKTVNFICNSCFERYKRRDLIQKIDDIIHIGYSQSKIDDFIPKNGFCPNFVDKRNIHCWNPLSPSKVVGYYNQSRVGIILSEVEGSCFSSGEYLLCGLPVVSTVCKGGREHWYNNSNSVICEANEASVLAACDLALEKLESGEFQPEKIRQGHIEEMNKQRQNLVDEVYRLFTLVTEDLPNKDELFQRLRFYHSNSNAFQNSDDYCKTQLSDEDVANQILQL